MKEDGHVLVIVGTGVVVLVSLFYFYIFDILKLEGEKHFQSAERVVPGCRGSVGVKMVTVGRVAEVVTHGECIWFFSRPPSVRRTCT